MILLDSEGESIKEEKNNQRDCKVVPDRQSRFLNTMVLLRSLCPLDYADLSAASRAFALAMAGLKITSSMTMAIVQPMG